MASHISALTIKLNLGADPDGLSIVQLRTLLDPQPTRRTLQRRLTELVAQGEIQKIGQGPATRYALEGPVARQEF